MHRSVADSVKILSRDTWDEIQTQVTCLSLPTVAQRLLWIKQAHLKSLAQDPPRNIRDLLILVVLKFSHILILCGRAVGCFNSCVFQISCSLTDGCPSCCWFHFPPHLNNTAASNIKKHCSCLTWHSVLDLREFAQTLFLWYAVLGVSLKPTLVWPYYLKLISSESHRWIAGLFPLHLPNLFQSYFWDKLSLLCTFLQCCTEILLLYSFLQLTQFQLLRLCR